MSYFAKGLTKRQIETFEQIAIGNDSGVNLKIADRLIETELIERHNVKFGYLTVYRYSVPIPVHIAWCEWCSKQPNLENF